MPEHFRKALQQWLDQLEQQSRQGTDWLQLWQSTLDRAPQHASPQSIDLVHQLTRQNQRFEELAQALLDKSNAGNLSREQLLQTYHQHLDGLCHDWIHSSCFLPDQLALLTPFFTVSPDPLQQPTDLEQIAQRLQNLSRLPRSLLQHLQAVISSLFSFQAAQRHHQQQLSRINHIALNHLADRLQSDGISDIKTLHTLWVEIFESDFNQALKEKDFIEGFNTLLDSGSAVRASWQVLTDHVCQRFGLVSLAEYDELSERHQALSDRVWQLEEQVEALLEQRRSANND